MCSHIWSVFSYWWSGACPEKFDTYGFAWYSTPASYPLYFISTLVFETPLYFLLLRKRMSLPKIALASLVVNLASHPAVYFLFPRIADEYGITFGWYVLYAEVFAVAIEGLLLWRVFRVKAMAAFSISLAVNLCSWLIGGEVLRWYLNR